MERDRLDDHNLYFHTLEDLLHRYRAETDQGHRQRLSAIITAMLEHADELGLTGVELGNIRAGCCKEFADLEAHGFGGPPGKRTKG